MIEDKKDQKKIQETNYRQGTASTLKPKIAQIKNRRSMENKQARRGRRCTKKTCKEKKGRGTKIRHEPSPQGGTLLPTAAFSLPLPLLLAVLALLLLVVPLEPRVLRNRGWLRPMRSRRTWAQVALLFALLVLLVLLVSLGLVLWVLLAWLMLAIWLLVWTMAGVGK